MRAAWRLEFLDLAASARTSFVGAPQAADFTSRSPNVSRDASLINTGIDLYNPDSAIRFSLACDGVYPTDQRSHAAIAKVTMSWCGGDDFDGIKRGS